MRGLLAQNEMNESLSSDVVSVLALGVWILSDDQFECRCGDQENAHEPGTCLCARHATDALGGTSSSAHSGCLETILVCSV